MTTLVGHIEALYRFPVKSMRGEHLDTATLGWHGIEGDRRLAFRRLDNPSDFPWLCGSMLPALTRFTPFRRDDAHDAHPTHVRTPEGDELALFGDELAAEVSRRYGAPVVMMPMKHGIFDEASVSVLASVTIDELCKQAGRPADARRFRPNIVVRSVDDVPFIEDAWVGAALTFGDASDAPSLAITRRDLRCSMVNIDPEHEGLSPDVLKACVRSNQNNAGVYAEVTRVGSLAVGQPVFLHRR